MICQETIPGQTPEWLAFGTTTSVIRNRSESKASDIIFFMYCIECYCMNLLAIIL